MDFRKDVNQIGSRVDAPEQLRVLSQPRYLPERAICIWHVLEAHKNPATVSNHARHHGGAVGHVR
jgi:hypothetical protein